MSTSPDINTQPGREWLGLALVCALSLAVSWHGFASPGMWWTDESRHAMHGVFFHDLFLDRPLSGHYAYAMEYFARYPALALNWYLPLFPAVMGAAMHVFGISEATAHGTVLVFWQAGLIAWYAWSRKVAGTRVAIASALMLALAPEMVLWSRSIMLEAPAVAMMMISLWAFERYIDKPGHVRASVVGLAVATALLVKQSVVFVVPALLAYAWLTGRGRTLFCRNAIGAWLIVSAAVALVVAHALLVGGTGVAATAGDLHEGQGGAAPRWSVARWVMHAEVLSTTMGAIPMLLAGLGLGTTLVVRKRRLRPIVLAAVWLVCWYLFATLMVGAPSNAVRFTVYALPAFALLATSWLAYLPTRPVPMAIVALLLGAWFAVQADALIRQPHRYVAGYEQVARAVGQLPNEGAILFAGKFDGSFIFHLRALDSARERVVLRADKLLVSMSVHKYFGVKSNVRSTAEIDAMIDKNAVRWVVIEAPDVVGLEEFGLLQASLNGSKYRLVSEVPIRSNLAEYAGLKARIYENTTLALPKHGLVKIEYPYFNRSFQFRFAPRP